MPGAGILTYYTKTRINGIVVMDFPLASRYRLIPRQISMHVFFYTRKTSSIELGAGDGKKLTAEGGVFCSEAWLRRATGHGGSTGLAFLQPLWSQI